MTVPLSDEEKRVLKTGAFGAVYLVSNADPGFFSMLRESFAASGALADSTGLVREVLTGGGQPRVPRRPPEAVAAVVLPALREAVGILRAKAPAELDQYRQTVLSAVRRVAAASNGIQKAEAAEIERIRAALDDPDGSGDPDGSSDPDGSGDADGPGDRAGPGDPSGPGESGDPGGPGSPRGA